MRIRLPVCSILVALVAPLGQGIWIPALAEQADSGPLGSHPLFVVGVPTPLSDTVDRAILERFGAEALAAALPLERIGALDGSALAADQPVIALGADACAAVIGAPLGQPLLCALLYQEAFEALDCAPACERLQALVLDQPPERQVRVASALFPTLKRFGLLRESPPPVSDAGIAWRAFDPYRRLSAQLTELLSEVDAVVVEPRVQIYPSQSLRTVLLTAYGWDRPIVGYGADWVRAGALVSAFSTADDVLHDIQDLLDARHAADRPAPPGLHAPRRFHVVENPAVARSLGLPRARVDTEDRVFTDPDLLP